MIAGIEAFALESEKLRQHLMKSHQTQSQVAPVFVAAVVEHGLVGYRV
jgi:hypothetical protein